MPGSEEIGKDADALLSASDRDRLAQAMAALCFEQGYGSTSEEEVAARAGLPPGRFEELFGDKSACAAAAIDAILVEVMAVVGSHYSPDLAERDSFLIGIKAILELLAAQPSFCHVSFVCARQMGPPRLGEILEAGANMLSAMLERLSGDGAHAAPARAARAALGGAEAVVRRELAAGHAAALPTLLPDFIYAATVPFLGQEEALRLARRGREVLAEGVVSD